MVKVVPYRLDFVGGAHCLIGGLKVVWTSKRDEHDDEDDDDISAGELFDTLVEVLGSGLLAFISCLFILF